MTLIQTVIITTRSFTLTMFFAECAKRDSHGRFLAHRTVRASHSFFSS